MDHCDLEHGIANFLLDSKWSAFPGCMFKLNELAFPTLKPMSSIYKTNIVFLIELAMNKSGLITIVSMGAPSLQVCIYKVVHTNVKVAYLVEIMADCTKNYFHVKSLCVYPTNVLLVLVRNGERWIDKINKIEGIWLDFLFNPLT